MAQEATESNWWIWKVFWLLFGITFVEVALGNNETIYTLGYPIAWN